VTHAFYHRDGAVQDTITVMETRRRSGKVRRYVKCRVRWHDNGETSALDLSADYQAGDATRVIYRGGSYVTDLNLSTGERPHIGDRLEGVAALLFVISIPLSFVLIGLPLYWGVTLYSKIATGRLRRRISDYIERNGLISGDGGAPIPRAA
jgi:hypothetical protein